MNFKDSVGVPALTVGLALVLIGTSVGQAAPPKGATGQCADGTYTTASSKEKGCTKHGGVKTWFASAPASSASSASTHATASAAATHAGARPKDATGQCADGTYTSAKTQDRGCTKHGGVKTWFGATEAAAATPAAAPAAASAPTPAVARHSGARPKDATGQCADGTYTTAKTQDRGCTKHGGVATWFGVAAATGTTPTAAATPTAASRPSAPAPAPVAETETAPAPVAAPAQTPSAPGQVWVNTATKVYHCAGTKWYGNTKAGKYMSEAEAKAAGYHADHGRACN